MLDVSKEAKELLVNVEEILENMNTHAKSHRTLSESINHNV